MNRQARPTLGKEEILRLAARAKLTLELGDDYCVNDLAGQREVLAFARLLEDRVHQALGDPPA